MASRLCECPGCVPTTDVAATEFASHEINPKPPFSHYRPSGEEGEAPLPAGMCCRERLTDVTEVVIETAEFASPAIPASI